VRGQVFEVKHLCAFGGERLEDARLGAAGGAADDAQVELLGDALDLGDDVVAEGLVAALELACIPAHHAQPGGE